MVRLYLDEDVAIDLMRLLHAMGHTVAHARRIFGQKQPDSKHLDYAAANDYVRLVHNSSDYYLLHDTWHRWTDRWGGDHAHRGIINVPHAHQRGILLTEVAQAVHERLFALGAINNQFYQWHPHHGWTEHPYQP